MPEVTITTTKTIEIEVPDMSNAVKSSVEYCAPLRRDTEEMIKTAETIKGNVVEQIITWINEYTKPFFNEEGYYIPSLRYDESCWEDSRLFSVYWHLSPAASSYHENICVESEGLSYASTQWLRSLSAHSISCIAEAWPRTKREIIRNCERGMELYEEYYQKDFNRSKDDLDAIESFRV